MKRLAAIFVSAALLAAPTAAIASGSSTGQQYNGGVQSVQDTNASKTPSPSGSATTTSTSASGQLPFTGLNVGELAAGGVLLLGSGVAVRRLTAQR